VVASKHWGFGGGGKIGEGFFGGGEGGGGAAEDEEDNMMIDESESKSKLRQICLRRAAGLGLSSVCYQDGLTGSLLLSLNSFYPPNLSTAATWRERYKRRKRELERERRGEEEGMTGVA